MDTLILNIKELLVSKTAKDSSIVFIGNLASAILGIIFTILAARFLGPENWGVVAAVGNMIPILIAFADFGLGSSLFQYASGKWHTREIKKVYISIFSLRFVTAAILTLGLIIFSKAFSSLAYAKPDQFLGIVTALGFLSVSLLDFQIFSIESKQKWKTAAILIGATNVFRVLGLGYLYLTSQVSLISILIIFVVGAFISLVFSFLFLPKGFAFSGWKRIQTLGRFSAWMGTNKIVSSISSRLDILLLLQLTGAYEAGIYGAASRLAMGVPLILGSLATVLASRFASIDEKASLKSFYNKSFGLALVVVSGLVVGIIVTPLITQLFGPEYKQTTSILQWLFIAMIPFALSTPAVNILIYHFKKPGIITIMSIIQLIIVLGTNYYLIPMLGVFAPVWGIGLSNLALFIVTVFFTWRYLR